MLLYFIKSEMPSVVKYVILYHLERKRKKNILKGCATVLYHLDFFYILLFKDLDTFGHISITPDYT